ncbi:ubiquinone/menaquinone biosynthesis methyltransferase; (ubiE) [Pyrococcus yayanosii CH1]|uniref:Ubiquinone/menaquinone biosynthesis methyltransferase (UbiE) n=1 Tax=Pyrococcus yayanosii (strain CH1 / JCM 16557) TaxID=529709 RepID=F8AJ36_PYRYC|nr:ubiquinone/menaquinone biosynthesis methyltransferase; (ubiE) [Pyrococcus yayanosii CH1]
MDSTARKYDRFSKIYDIFEIPMETWAFSKYRQKALSLVKGKVLEIGVGTGKNLPYYPAGVEVIGIDISKGMLERAERRRRKLGLDNVKLLLMDVQNLEFEDNTFDTILSTFVFCTVPDPLKGLREAYRVLKPGGKAIFLEHMKSESRLLNIPLYLIDPRTKALVGTSMVGKLKRTLKRRVSR